MRIEQLTATQHLQAFTALRQKALESLPPVFAEPPEAFAALSESERAARLSDHGVGDFVLGCFAGADERLVGLTGVYHERSVRMAHRANVWGVYVLPEYRGQGIARRLMQAAIDRVRSIKRAELLALRVTTDNLGALSLYESMGFERYGTEARAMRVSGAYIDEHLLQRVL